MWLTICLPLTAFPYINSTFDIIDSKLVSIPARTRMYHILYIILYIIDGIYIVYIIYIIYNNVQILDKINTSVTLQ